MERTRPAQKGKTRASAGRVLPITVLVKAQESSWRCRTCSLVPASYRYPSSPNTPCASCGRVAEPTDALVAALLSLGASQLPGADAEPALSAMAAPQSDQQPSAPDAQRGALLSLRKAAARLGVSRSRTLLPAIAAGLVRVVKVGKRDRVPADELERISRDGLMPAAAARRRTKAKGPSPRDPAAEAATVLAMEFPLHRP